MIKLNVASSADSKDFTAQLRELGLNVFHYNCEMYISGTEEQVATGFSLAATYDFQAGINKDKGEYINLDRAKALVAPVLFEGNYYDADDASIANLTATVAAFNAGVPVPAGFTWRTADNQNIPMTLQNLVALAGTFLASRFAAYQQSWAAKAAL